MKIWIIHFLRKILLNDLESGRNMKLHLIMNSCINMKNIIRIIYSGCYWIDRTKDERDREYIQIKG